DHAGGIVPAHRCGKPGAPGPALLAERGTRLTGATRNRRRRGAIFAHQGTPVTRGMINAYVGRSGARTRTVEIAGRARPDILLVPGLGRLRRVRPGDLGHRLRHPPARPGHTREVPSLGFLVVPY